MILFSDQYLAQVLDLLDNSDLILTIILMIGMMMILFLKVRTNSWMTAVGFRLNNNDNALRDDSSSGDESQTPISKDSTVVQKKEIVLVAEVI